MLCMNLPVAQDESTEMGWYGAFASRTKANRNIWYCTDSDYSWYGVMDDFGNIVAVSSYTNNRGY